MQRVGPKPITKQRSIWEEVESPEVVARLERIGATDVAVFRRNVSDGCLVAICADEPEGYHLSISFRTPSSKRLPRYPTWDEITQARYSLMPNDIDFVMHLPPAEDYVALDDTTFHLHQHPAK